MKYLPKSKKVDPIDLLPKRGLSLASKHWALDESPFYEMACHILDIARDFTEHEFPNKWERI